MYCTNCGKEIKKGNKFCTNCGCKIKIYINKLNNNTENYKITKEEKVILIIVSIYVTLHAIYLLIRQGVINVGGF